MWRDFSRSLKTREERLAWLVAIGADALQLAVMPLFAEGALSPADAVLDAVVAVALVRLLGWHWAFLPTLMIEALPGADLFPTWTAAVFFVTRQMHSPGEPVILPPESPAGRSRS
jgi:mannose/fructose/N-acetylgalactosamine-specific phosphotransferase system component IIC